MTYCDESWCFCYADDARKVWSKQAEAVSVSDLLPRVGILHVGNRVLRNARKYYILL